MGVGFSFNAEVKQYVNNFCLFYKPGSNSFTYLLNYCHKEFEIKMAKKKLSTLFIEKYKIRGGGDDDDDDDDDDSLVELNDGRQTIQDDVDEEEEPVLTCLNFLDHKKHEYRNKLFSIAERETCSYTESVLLYFDVFQCLQDFLQVKKANMNRNENNGTENNGTENNDIEKDSRNDEVVKKKKKKKIKNGRRHDMSSTINNSSHVDFLNSVLKELNGTE